MLIYEVVKSAAVINKHICLLESKQADVVKSGFLPNCMGSYRLLLVPKYQFPYELLLEILALKYFASAPLSLAIFVYKFHFDRNVLQNTL